MENHKTSPKYSAEVREHAEILIEMDTQSTAMLMSHPDRAGPGGMGMMMNMTGNSETFPIFNCMRGVLKGMRRNCRGC